MPNLPRPRAYIGGRLLPLPEDGRVVTVYLGGGSAAVCNKEESPASNSLGEARSCNQCDLRGWEASPNRRVAAQIERSEGPSLPFCSRQPCRGVATMDPSPPWQTYTRTLRTLQENLVSDDSLRWGRIAQAPPARFPLAPAAKHSQLRNTPKHIGKAVQRSVFLKAVTRDRFRATPPPAPGGLTS